LSPEIGYWIAPDHSGKSITTRSVQALTKLGLDSLGLDRIVIRANPDNIGSNKVAEKSGYMLVGNEIEDGVGLNVWMINKDR
jgi:RimJ/RimL family protein N-acetyltransferase